MDDKKLVLTPFPVFKDSSSEDCSTLIKKLLMCTTLDDYKNIDPLVIYLNILNFITPGVVKENFSSILKDYNYEIKCMEFDDFIKGKFGSLRLHTNMQLNDRHNRQVRVCTDFDDLSEYEGLTSQHILCLFEINSCFVGWQIKDANNFHALIHKWMNIFAMTASANHHNEGFWSLKPSRAFALDLHKSIALTKFRAHIVKHLKELMTRDLRLFSISTQLTWDILAGAGLRDFILVCWHIVNKSANLYRRDKPQNTLQDIIAALKKYRELGPHCMLLHSYDELLPFKSMVHIRQFLESPPFEFSFGHQLKDFKKTNPDQLVEKEKNIDDTNSQKAQNKPAFTGNVPITNYSFNFTTSAPISSTASNNFCNVYDSGYSSAKESPSTPLKAAVFVQPPQQRTSGMNSLGCKVDVSPSTTLKQGNQLALQQNNLSPVKDGCSSKDDIASGEDELFMAELKEYDLIINEVARIKDKENWFQAYNPHTITCINTELY